MDNQFFGIIIIILCFIGYFFSWKYKSRNNFFMAVFLLILCGFALRLFTSTDFFLHAWDERYHALVAKNLIQHPFIPTLYDNPILPFDFQNWTANHIWVHKQPLPLWTMAGSMWLFGVNEVALRLPSIILTTLGIWLTFSIGKFLFNNKIGYLAAFFYSINGLIIEVTAGRVATDHIDVFFLFFVELAIFFSIQFVISKKTIFNIFVGISLGFAILSKWLPALIVLPIWLVMVVGSKNLTIKSILLQFTVLLITTLAIFLPWQLYIYTVFPVEAAWETGFNLKHITQALEGHEGSLLYFADKIRINYGELVYLPLIWFLWKTVKNTKDNKRLVVLIWFWVPFLFFSFVKTKMQAYILFASPALFLMTSEFWFFLNNYRKQHKLRWLFALILILLIALPIRYTIERVKPFEKYNRNPPWTQQLKSLNNRNIASGILLNYERPIEAMFYTNLTVYSELPDKDVIMQLMAKGHKIIINDDGTIPADIKIIPGVTIEYFSTSDK